MVPATGDSSNHPLTKSALQLVWLVIPLIINSESHPCCQGGVTTVVPATGAAGGSTHAVSSTHAVIHVVRGDTTSTAAGDSSNIPPIYSSLRVTLGGDI